MKRNKKLTILALSVMLVMTLAVTVISFSLANQGGESGTDSVTIVSTDTAGATLTNIDYIIKGCTADEPYKIIEIGSVDLGSSGDGTEIYSSFGEFVAKNDAFRNYVINGNKTIAEEMASKAIEYKYYYSANVTDNNTTALADISNADFIYVSNDASKPYSTDNGNDINEELYNILHIYAVGDYKPFVIDKPASGSSSIGGGTGGTTTSDYTVNDLISDYYAKDGYLYNTYSWPQNASADDFYAGKGQSLFISISGRAKYESWINVSLEQGESTADQSTFKQLTEVLVISNSGTELSNTESTMVDLALSGATEVDIAATPLKDMDNNVNITLESNQKVYNIENSALYANGYSARYSEFKPEYARVTEVTLAQLEADTAFAYGNYDLIIMEDDLSGKALEVNLYKRLIGAMYGKTHIVFNSTLGTASSTPGSGDDDLKTSNDSNYNELFYMVATEDGIERYQNIMVTTKTELDIIMSSNNSATCKIIADLINASSFRGIGGPAQSSNLYTVLEIQPCYPIDTALATIIGDYYTSPSNMVNGKTREQLGISSDKDLTKDTPQYYAWELSEAKVAEITGLDVSQVKVVHMSTEELATSKTEVLGNYDLVYIGGNTSALKSANDWYSVNQYQSGLSTNSGISVDKLAYAPIYSMYYHNGDIVYINLDAMKESPGPANSGTPLAYGDYEYAVTGSSTGSSGWFTTYNGNDITYANLTSLCEYVDAGMPVVVSKDLYAAYDIMNKATDNSGAVNRYLQNSIDPDSNVCAFLDYCNNLTTNGSKNVLWNFDQNNTEQVDNDGGRLGDTATGTVQVFAGDDKDNLESLINSSTLRPKLAVTSMPATYNMYDKSTRLTTKTLKFEYDITNVSSDYTVNLYLDYNGNSVFSEDEKFETSTTNSLSCDLTKIEEFGEDYFGPVYWQLEVVSKTGNKEATAVTSGITYIAGESAKQQVDVLQIIPDDASTTMDTSGMNGTCTLLFCTECQRSLEVLEYNPGSDSEYGDFTCLYDGHISQDFLKEDHTYAGVYMGRHEHNFGIVKYDSTMTMLGTDRVGMDDWNSNFADEVSDLYDFDIDILTSRQYEEYNKLVQTDVNSRIAELYAAKEIKHNSVATLTTDEKAAVKASFMEDAAAVYSDYERAISDVNTAENALKETLLVMIDNGDALVGTEGESDKTALFQEIYNTGRYGDFYLIWSTSYEGGNGSKHYDTVFSDGVNYTTLYEAYARAVDVKLAAKDEYDRYCRAANYENWLLGCYSCVIIGPAEDFGGDDIYDEDINEGYGALDVLEDYIEKDGTVLLFHDTLTKFSDSGASNLTQRLRASFGMDKNHMSDLNDEIVTASGNSSELYYLPYEVDDDYSTDKYFMTNLSYKDTSDTTRYLTWLDDMTEGLRVSQYWSPSLMKGAYLSTTAYTDAIYATKSTNAKLHYTYAEYSWSKAAYWNNSAKNIAEHGANRATQVNKGITTLYPFTLSDRLNISPTHSQSYALDIEQDDMTVWYTLAGGTFGNDSSSSLFAASPNDGTDSYFIYSFGNVNYCGAGHAEITGAGRDNNDERRLYINIICNSVTNVPVTTISVYDYEKTTNNVVQKNGNEYIYKLSESDNVPEFSYKFNLGKGLNVRNVNIYYDIDEDGLYSAGDVYIKQYSASDVESGKLIDVPFTVDNSYTVNAKVTIDETAYKSLTDGNYLKLQSTLNILNNKNESVSQSGDAWVTLDKDSFVADGDKYTADISIMFKDKPGEVTGINFDMLGVGFNGNVIIGEVNVTDKADTTSESDKVIFKNAQSIIAKDVNFSGYTTEDEESKVTVGYDDYKIKIDPTYLTNGKYVYIVVEVVTDKGITRKRIRVEYKDPLYNLT